jgi:elongation factor Ts
MSGTRVIESYIHNGRVGVLIELALDTSFTARMAEVGNLAKDIALHVAAAAPDSLETLLQQPFVKDAAITVGDLLANTSDHLGEHITVTRFVRWDSEGPSTPSIPPNEPVAARVRSVR